MAAPPEARQPGRGRRLLLPAAAVLGVLAVLSFAWWSVGDAGRLAPASGDLVVGEGVAHVDAVLSATRPQHAMPGMGSDDDPVAEGRRRVSIELTLRAKNDEVRVRARDFTLQTPGEQPLTPHRSLLPETEMPSGTSLSGVLVFDVPRDARVGELAHVGSDSSTKITLPAEDAPIPPSRVPGSPTTSQGHTPARTAHPPGHPTTGAPGQGSATSGP